MVYTLWVCLNHNSGQQLWHSPARRHNVMHRNSRGETQRHVWGAGAALCQPLARRGWRTGPGLGLGLGQHGADGWIFGGAWAERSRADSPSLVFGLWARFGPAIRALGHVQQGGGGSWAYSSVCKDKNTQLSGSVLFRRVCSELRSG